MTRSAVFMFLVGQAFFGLLIGLLVGLSVSPIVSSLVGLLFGFIGGSVIVLIKERTERELTLIGGSISALALFMFLGVILGISIRANDLLSIKVARNAPYTLSADLTVGDIRNYGREEQFVPLIVSLVSSGAQDNAPTKVLDSQDLRSLLDAKVDSRVLCAMLTDDGTCANRELAKKERSEKQGSHLYGDEAEAGDLERDRKSATIKSIE